MVAMMVVLVFGGCGDRQSDFDRRGGGDVHGASAGGGDEDDGGSGAVGGVFCRHGGVPVPMGTVVLA